jgi:uncharacterized membrane protein YgcG
MAVCQLASLMGFAVAGIYSPEKALPAQTVQQFLADPAALLRQNPTGGPVLIELVRDLAASDDTTLNPILELLERANSDQATAIGTALGQVALLAVKVDQAYAVRIQEAMAKASPMSAQAGVGPKSAEPKIGSAVTTKDQVDGVTEKGMHPIAAGTEVYSKELVRTGTSGMAQLLFADRTNLSVGPVAEVRLDKFIYDPNAKSGKVVVVASEGAFRFITGLQPSRNYEIKIPYGSLGVRGTEFIVLIKPNEEQIQLNRGKVIVTTISNKVVTIDTPHTVLTIDSHGNTQGPTPMSEPLVNFADLGAPVTNTSFADAQDAFSNVTGNSGIGATGGAGGGGEAPTGQGGGGVDFGGGGSSPNLKTTVVTLPSDFLTETLFSSGGSYESVSPH